MISTKSMCRKQIRTQRNFPRQNNICAELGKVLTSLGGKLINAEKSLTTKWNGICPRALLRMDFYLLTLRLVLHGLMDALGVAGQSILEGKGHL